jgi:hypothetical protein
MEAAMREWHDATSGQAPLLQLEHQLPAKAAAGAPPSTSSVSQAPKPKNTAAKAASVNHSGSSNKKASLNAPKSKVFAAAAAAVPRKATHQPTSGVKGGKQSASPRLNGRPGDDIPLPQWKVRAKDTPPSKSKP